MICQKCRDEIKRDYHGDEALEILDRMVDEHMEAFEKLKSELALERSKRCETCRYKAPFESGEDQHQIRKENAV